MADEAKDSSLEAEFDSFADEYYQNHKANIAISGEDPEYFSRYKIADLLTFFDACSPPKTILDFGSGVGNSIPYFREYFSQSQLTCADVSARSMEISRTRFPGNERYLKIGDSIPTQDASFDAAFTACVFHHISIEERAKWIRELWRVVRQGGVLAIYEHNPLNPLTLRAVNTCPFDVNAKLIRARAMKKILLDNGWGDVNIEYKVFFPRALRALRPLEKYAKNVFLGAQWRITAVK